MSDTINIMDFSDLGKPFQFRYNNFIYQVPIIPPRVARELIEMGRNISNKAKKTEDKVKELEEKGEDIPEEIYKELGLAFDFQIDFILKTGIQKVQEGVPISTVTKEEVTNDWSTRLVTRVFNQINKLLTVDETEQEKKS